jgi:uncharacterized protein (TIGR00730 family)
MAVDDQLDALLDAAGAKENRRVLRDILATAVGLAGDDVDPLDLKITRATLAEMRDAFRTFAPYRGVPKVTMFGSARVKHDDPHYVTARDVAARLATEGWMVVTGAGPGIMAAGMEGAGRERSFGVTIRLPHEQEANPVILGDPKLVSMKYFFTRKLMLIKESKAFVCLPGGFGTLDETFELLTLTQTGKGVPVPIVLLDTPGGWFWRDAAAFIDGELAARGLIGPNDHALFLVTDDADRAVAEIVRFYATYDSIRFVGTTLVIRLHRTPSEAELVDLNTRFGHLCTGAIRLTEPLRDEVADGDRLDLARLRLDGFTYDQAGLRQLINALNEAGP